MFFVFKFAKHKRPFVVYFHTHNKESEETVFPWMFRQRRPGTTKHHKTENEYDDKLLAKKGGKDSGFCIFFATFAIG